MSLTPCYFTVIGLEQCCLVPDSSRPQSNDIRRRRFVHLRRGVPTEDFMSGGIMSGALCSDALCPGALRPEALCRGRYVRRH